jgi:3-oxoacyl-[acyl-carrier-protein] synthase II
MACFWQICNKGFAYLKTDWRATEARLNGLNACTLKSIIDSAKSSVGVESISLNSVQLCFPRSRNNSAKNEIMKRRVVITGIGLVTPVGCGQGGKIFNQIISGKSGIRPIPADYKIPDQCNVTFCGSVPKGTGPDEYNDHQHRNIKETSLFIRYALTAAQHALDHAQLVDLATHYDMARCGAAIGSGGIGSISEITSTYDQLCQSYNKVSPYFVPKVLVNMASGHLSLKHNLRGPVHSVATACAAGLHSIGDAFNFIRLDMADLLLAGGADASIDALSIAGFNRMKALSNPPSDDINASAYIASRPFDKNRNGFVIAEGAGVVVLEELQSALRRKAPIIAEICGYGLSGDAYHSTSPSPEGSGAMQSMANALRDAKLDISAIDYVNAHATSTPVGDAVEVKALARLLEESQVKRDKALYVSSTKGHTGHLLGAAGAMELGFTAMALQTGVLPGTLNLRKIDPALQYEGLIQHIPHDAILFSTGEHASSVPVTHRVSDRTRYALKNSFGFGGTNASLVLATSPEVAIRCE